MTLESSESTFTCLAIYSKYLGRILTKELMVKDLVYCATDTGKRQWNPADDSSLSAIILRITLPLHSGWIRLSQPAYFLTHKIVISFHFQLFYFKYSCY